MTAEQMVHMLQVLFPHMNPSDRQAFLSDIKESQPEKFTQVWAHIRLEFAQQERDKLTQVLGIQ